MCPNKAFSESPKKISNLSHRKFNIHPNRINKTKSTYCYQVDEPKAKKKKKNLKQSQKLPMKECRPDNLQTPLAVTLKI